MRGTFAGNVKPGCTAHCTAHCTALYMQLEQQQTRLSPAMHASNARRWTSPSTVCCCFEFWPQVLSLRWLLSARWLFLSLALSARAQFRGTLYSAVTFCFWFGWLLLSVSEFRVACVLVVVFLCVVRAYISYLSIHLASVSVEVGLTYNSPAQRPDCPFFFLPLSLACTTFTSTTTNVLSNDDARHDCPDSPQWPRQR